MEELAEREQPALLPRRFGLIQATALNMSNMIGVGPFITIPLLMSALGGPQALLGWLIGMVVAVFDGMVWSELGAAMPGSGGSYVYLREGFGRNTFGRLMAFLFIWQFIFSGPLEIASGYIGFAKYVGFIWKGLTPGWIKVLAAGVGLLNIALLYRQITSIGKITVSLWIGTLITTAMVIATGVMHFDPQLAFDFPPNAFRFSFGFLLGLGAASRVAIYDFLGYYDICYIGAEVKNPGKVIPRSIIISVLVVALMYLGVNLSVIGVVPWREFVPAESHPNADFIVSIFMERIFGHQVAVLFTAMILWTAFGSVFALLLGYSRIPYAAALDGGFFKIFGRLHPRHQFPYISLLVMGMLSMLCSFIDLGMVIDALITTRILVQFIGQIGAVWRLRKSQPQLARPYRIWLYPVPTVVALAGWIFVFATSEPAIILFGLGTLAAGVVLFLIWSWRCRFWPFAGHSIPEGL